MAATLIVLAATMGNKYGGLKQLEGIGPHGETILDYSIYDAIKVGFTKIVFVISKSFEAEFKEYVSGRYEHAVDVQYVYQEVEQVAEELRSPKRSLLWGSAHALLVGRAAVTGSFGVINAVNFYQRESFELLYQTLHATPETPYFMIGYRLKNVLPESGAVARGICRVDGQGMLLSVENRQGVEVVSGDPMYKNELNKWEPLNENSFVSMNMWGLSTDIFPELQNSFDDFVAAQGTDLTAHFSIPGFMNEMIAKQLPVKVIETPGRWMGLVSQDDRSQVIMRINEMIRKGVYPTKLFKLTLSNNNEL